MCEETQKLSETLDGTVHAGSTKGDPWGSWTLSPLLCFSFSKLGREASVPLSLGGICPLLQVWAPANMEDIPGRWAHVV